MKECKIDFTKMPVLYIIIKIMFSIQGICISLW